MRRRLFDLGSRISDLGSPEAASRQSPVASRGLIFLAALSIFLPARAAEEAGDFQKRLDELLPGLASPDAARKARATRSGDRRTRST